MKKIAILGSTGSIGKSLLDIISKDKNNFEIVLLTANKDHRTLIKQAKRFKVKNLILRNFDSSRIAQKKLYKQNVKVFNSFEDISKIIKKLDYVMSSIVGIDGLDPTLKIIKLTKNIAIANKSLLYAAGTL